MALVRTFVSPRNGLKPVLPATLSVKNRRIGILIAGMAVAMIGLILIQGYWIHGAYTMRQDQFNQEVVDVLETVVERVERSEAMQKLRDNSAGDLLFRSIDTLVAQSTSGPDSVRPDYFYISDIRQQGDQVEIKIIEEKDGKRRTKLVRSEPFLDDTASHLNIDWDENNHLSPHDGNPLIGTEDFIGTEDWKQNLEQRSGFVSEMVKSLMHGHIFEKLEERLDSALLDSILNQELQRSGITAGVVFAVFNEQDELVLTNGPAQEADLRNSGHRAHMFPNDLAGARAQLALVFPKQRGYVLGTLTSMLLISALLILGLIYGFYFSVSTIIRQKKVSEIKNDFINNMTHELKTPISTISLACQALSDPDINASSNLVVRYVGMIGDENKRLGSLVERVLQSAVLDKGDFKLRPEQVNINELVAGVVDKTGIRVRERNGSVNLKLDESVGHIKGDREHLTNVLYNLVDNAIKYSPDSPELILSTSASNGNVSVSVADKGIGISKENLKRVFEKLYRVPRGNVHDVKGFGLGLHYVKVIIERHHGVVTAESKQGAGSTFTITLPTDYEQQTH